jgi:serine phosphatase RsbU (regulator of sigma subunit)/pSer/pThr/pTyr-binding forkhead associated (FHA) protein
MLRLTGTDGSRLYDFELAPGAHTVGRSSEHDFCIPDKTVSRRHATVEVSADGAQIHVTDSGSHNGTAVNARRVQARTALKAGDTVTFGRVDFKVRESGDAAAKSQPAPSLLADIEPEKSVFLSIKEALQPLPAKVSELPQLFPTLSEIARMHMLQEPQQDMLERALTLVNKVIPAERLAVLMRTENSADVYIAASLLPGGKDPGTFRLSRTIVNDIFTEKRAIVIGNPAEDPRFAQQASIIQADLRSAMAVPLFDEGRVLGILYVDTTSPLHRYNDDYLRVLATFGNIIAARLLNYELLEERQEKQVYEAELNRASSIQKNLLARQLPAVAGYQLFAFQEQCRAVGGDLYDVARLSDGRIVLLLADVSGKGMGAALLMANILASFRILYNVTEFSLSDVVRLVSSQLHASSSPSDFATLFVGVLNPETHELHFINAGHNPPLLVKADGACVQLPPSGTMIGAFDFGAWTEDTVILNPTDLLFVYTDGVPEATRGDELYSEQRMQRLVTDCRSDEPEQIAGRLMTDIDRFLGDSPRSDDITMLILKRND